MEDMSRDMRNRSLVAAVLSVVNPAVVAERP
jgi:hypothetical protein